MRKNLYTVLAAAAATVLVGLGAAAPASAAVPHTADTLTVGSAIGPNVAVGDVLNAALTGTSTLATSSGNITCTAGSFGATAATNGAATATETVTSFTMTASSCTSKITGTTKVVSIGLKTGTAPVATVTASSATLSVTPTVTVVLGSILGNVTCYFSGAATGSLSNSAHSLTFTNVAVTKQSGSSSLCPSSSTFSATYSPVLDATQANGVVYVN